MTNKNKNVKKPFYKTSWKTFFFVSRLLVDLQKYRKVLHTLQDYRPSVHSSSGTSFSFPVKVEEIPLKIFSKSRNLSRSV